MKKLNWALCILVLLLGMALCVNAFAESTLTRIYDLGTGLLFSEDNVSLDGQAVFMLDGTVFKTAEGSMTIAGEDSSRSITLTAPRAEGGERVNGYAITVKNGQRYSWESAIPGIYQVRYFAPRQTLLRNSVSREQTVALGRSAIAVLDMLTDLPVVITELETGGTEVCLKLAEGEIPAFLSTVAGQVFRDLTMEVRYFSFFGMPVEGYAEIGDYMTTTEGILYCLRSLDLTSAEVTFGLDETGRLTGIKGKVQTKLTTRLGEVHELSAEGTLNIHDYGTTAVKDFDPGEFGLTAENEINDSYSYELLNGVLYDLTDLPVFEDQVIRRELPDEEAALSYAKEILQMDFIGLFEFEDPEWSVTEEDGHWTVYACGGEGETLAYLELEKDGTIVCVSNLCSGMYAAEESRYANIEDPSYIEWCRNIALLIEDAADRMNPGETDYWRSQNPNGNENGMLYVGHGGELTFGEARFQYWYTDPNAERTYRGIYIVQVAPVVRVVYYYRYNNVSEGGNG